MPPLEAAPITLGDPHPPVSSNPSSPPSPVNRSLNLVLELAITQFKLKYTGSVLGYLWSLLKPAMLFGITYVIFARVLKAGGNDTTFPMQLLVAIILWTFFADATSTAISSIASGGNIIRKAYFPRWTLVAASTGSALLTLTINLTLMVAIAAPLGALHLTATSLLVFVFIAELYVLAFGIGLFLSALFVFYRDIGHMWEVFSQVLFYGSMIVFPFSRVPDHGPWRSIIFFNPVAQIVEDVRHVLVAAPTAPWTEQIVGATHYLIPLGVVALTAVVGALVFRSRTPLFAEAL